MENEVKLIKTVEIPDQNTIKKYYSDGRIVTEVQFARPLGATDAEMEQMKKNK